MYKVSKSMCHDREFKEYLEELLKAGRIESGAPEGITKLVLSNGVDKLSDKQWALFRDMVMEPNIIESCTACANKIPFCEMLEAVDNGGYCSWCAHMMEKRERE